MDGIELLNYMCDLASWFMYAEHLIVLPIYVWAYKPKTKYYSLFQVEAARPM